MPVASSFLGGFALSAALIVAIGAQNAFVLRQGLRREHVGPIVLFCALADIALMAAGVAGLGAALDGLPGLAAALTLGGAAFLGWYGLGALRRALRPAAALAAEGGGTAMPLGAALARTAGFTLLNPHVYLDTVLLVGAVGAAQPPGGQPAFIAGAGLASALWFAALGYGARLLAPVFARPAAWRVLDAVIGATMLALAAGLAARGLG
ncbi:LysE/ArgO family amino acid transporter [Paracraurococcus ruber]|uniref:Amino acid transporter n=1 Tax=Paracraurococcus ruber TaxID=77675 RepID=A0ABS1D4G2_9PROT|nr:LysE family transporter [Paracraurococcus ruber]MBK1661751.1 amino acid transporter [Paracraurococcus ruber]TDG18371.1 amino acid transporter [Paracraurococcus ruber]